MSKRSTIACDFCDRPYGTTREGFDFIYALRCRAAEDGWVVNHAINLDTCPECLAEQKEAR